MIYLFRFGQGCEFAKGEERKYLFRAANVWWICAQYFVIASCGEIPRDNICMYMAHACFSVLL